MNKVAMLVLVACYPSGCVMTKVITVPMRVAGSVISVVPVIGDGVEGVIGKSADLIDAIPI
jgi:hypothetical protein